MQYIHMYHILANTHTRSGHWSLVLITDCAGSTVSYHNLAAASKGIDQALLVMEEIYQ